jgi:hypothetical protein
MKKFTNKGFEVISEPRVPLSNTFCKPDLIVLKGTRASVLDVQICGETQLNESYRGKIEKYGNKDSHMAICNYLKATHPTVSQVEHEPVIVNLRGIIHPRSAMFLKSKQFKIWDVADVCTKTIIGSMKTYDIYMRGT